MQNLNNFANFELTTKEAQNVNGGRIMVIGRRTRRTTTRIKEIAANDFTSETATSLEEAVIVKETKVQIQSLANNEIIL